MPVLMVSISSVTWDSNPNEMSIFTSTLTFTANFLIAGKMIDQQHNNPFSKAGCPQVEHFYAFFPEFNSYQTNANVPIFQQIF
jgi:hypothetical protein